MKLSFVNKPRRKKENYERKKKPKKRFRVNKKIEGNKATIFIGSEDPFIYFPDIMSCLNREEITNLELKARGRSISNAVNVSEQFQRRFKDDFNIITKNVDVGTEEVQRKDKKGTFKMSYIIITIADKKKTTIQSPKD